MGNPASRDEEWLGFYGILPPKAVPQHAAMDASRRLVRELKWTVSEELPEGILSVGLVDENLVFTSFPSSFFDSSSSSSRFSWLKVLTLL